MKLNLIALLSTVLFLCSCENGSSDKHAVSTKSIAFSGETSDNLNSRSTEYYTYDGQGRLIKTEYSVKRNPATYVYNESTIKTSTEKTGELEYTLDRNGRIISAAKPGTNYKVEVKYNDQGKVSELVLDARNFTHFAYNGESLTRVEDIADKKKTTYTVTTGQDTIKNKFLLGNIYFDLFAMVSYQSHFMSKVYRDILGNFAQSQTNVGCLGFSKVDIVSTDRSANGSINYVYEKNGSGDISSVTQNFENRDKVWRKFTYSVVYDDK